ncbi:MULTISPECIES: type IA DNA topoisomerase [Vibrio]|uniref:DNA topoisomerase n=1 Tax=Vibrio tasmaniensis TaxID=212663 RepID=A0A2N7NCZ1_9VIBR|nr:DNA topoisomerase [Vibrio tasmaniensis]PMO89855.1 hypothetical protein BCT01_00820 [Vibrio tasmaniensis]PMP09973.1 hypothetical protein BCS92_02270 [Vibrio tasmaniensis]TKG27962.1 type I DNA topoisomerase [Vibrio tasmaniensis]TKG40553.1 type I DNA topoisomerase [Vibrio tasmaniensis]TKG41673.1 type I DNA topoisomerase [Vibrio tasmaniensis]
MAKTLLIVESPKKIENFQKYLGDEYIIKASVGHIRDLPSNDMGLDENLRPIYVETKPDVIAALKRAAKQCSQVVIMTDLDREGEAIGWHLVDALDLGDNYIRCTTNNLSKDGILKALNNPRKLDMNQVYAQESRRVLDRLVGFKVSGLTSKLLSLPSAGRVQSPALRLLVDRQELIDKFSRVPYHDLSILHPAPNGKQWMSKLDVESMIATGKIDHLLSPQLLDDAGRPKQRHITNPKFIQTISDEVFRRGTIRVVSFSQKDSKTKAHAPFTTSTMIQSASNSIGLSTEQAMLAAQGLFEKGLITYHRTDSTTFEADSLKLVRDFIDTWQKGKGTDRYLSPTINSYPNPNGAQAGHEAIRPTNFNYDLSLLTNAQERDLYKLIFCRTVASQMSDALFSTSEVVLDGGFEIASVPVRFKAHGRIPVFDGWKSIYSESEELGEFDEKPSEQLIPEVFNDQSVQVLNCSVQKKTTKPPSRYTEASLVCDLEKRGIGRPSTYATIFKTLYSRPYIKADGRFLSPMKNGTDLISNLKNRFKFVEYDFTVAMELEIDKVASGRTTYDMLVPKLNAELDMEIESFVAHSKSTIRFCHCPKCDKESLIKKINQKKKFTYWSCTTENCEGFYPDKDNNPNTDYKPAQKSQFDCPKCKKLKLSLSRENADNPKRWFFCTKECNFLCAAKPDSNSSLIFTPDLSEYERNHKYNCPKCKSGFLKNLFKRDQERTPFWMCENDKKCKTYIEDINGSPNFDLYEIEFKRNHTHKCPSCGPGYLKFNQMKTDAQRVWWSCDQGKGKCNTSLNDKNGSPDIDGWNAKVEELAKLVDCPNCRNGKLIKAKNKPLYRCSNTNAKGASKCMTFIDCDSNGQPDLDKHFNKGKNNSSQVKPTVNACPNCKEELKINKLTHKATCINKHTFKVNAKGVILTLGGAGQPIIQ